jgi:hypothetical protein
MLAASVNFEIEFEAFPFVDGRQAGTLHRADVHEGIGLTIIAHQEAETLHRIEEFDRPGNPLTRQLALRGSWRTRRNRDHIADNLKILSGNLAAAIHQIEFEFLPFGQPFKPGTFDRADVHKHIFAAGFLLDEAKALLRVEKLHHAFAGSDDLRGHAVETAATAARSTGATRTAAATRAAAKTAAIAAAEAATITTAKAAAVTTAAIITKAAGRLITIHTATKRIEVVFAKTVTLVAAAPAPPIVTHKSIHTLSGRLQIVALIMAKRRANSACESAA